MTRIYLDVRDHVRVDTTPDEREAKAAAADRAALRFLDCAERLGRRLLRHDLEHGGDLDASLEHLSRVHALRQETLRHAG